MKSINSINLFKVFLGFLTYGLSLNLSCQLLKGQVINAADQSGIVYALIYKKDKSDGTYTDSNGYFQFNCAPTDTLVVSHVSYHTRELVAKDIDNTIALEQNHIQLEEVIVSANSKKRKIKEKYGVIECTSFGTSYALAIPPSDNKKLVGVSIYISKSGNPKAPFKIILKEDLNKEAALSSGVYKVVAKMRKEWLDILFKEPIVVEEELYAVFEQLYDPRYDFRSLNDECNGVALGLSDVYNPNQKILLKFKEGNWGDMKLVQNGFNLMFEPIWEN